MREFAVLVEFRTPTNLTVSVPFYASTIDRAEMLEKLLRVAHQIGSGQAPEIRWVSRVYQP